jgi:hypothetical protein
MMGSPVSAAQLKGHRLVRTESENTAAKRIPVFDWDPERTAEIRQQLSQSPPAKPARRLERLRMVDEDDEHDGSAPEWKRLGKPPPGSWAYEPDSLPSVEHGVFLPKR